MLLQNTGRRYFNEQNLSNLLKPVLIILTYFIFMTADSTDECCGGKFDHRPMPTFRNQCNLHFMCPVQLQIKSQN